VESECRVEQDAAVKRVLATAVIAATVAFPAQAAPSCQNISVTPLAFGNYDVYNAAAVDSVGTISYSCPPPTLPTVTIDAGLAFAGGHRRMTLGAGVDWLSYDIYVDAARTVVWSSTPVAVVPLNNTSVDFYGRIFALQDVSVGSYTDTVVVTFNF
jgi:spore coat protein U-like protein